MKGDKQTIDNLQSAAQMLATMAEQFRIDELVLKDLGFKKLSKRACSWYYAAEKYLEKMIDRLTFFETAVKYATDEVSAADNVDETLARALTLSMNALTQFKAYRKAAWDVDADYTPDIYEHTIKMLEKQAEDIAEQQSLIKSPASLLITAR